MGQDRRPGDPRGTSGNTARYFVLTAEEVAALSPRDQERYAAHRREFDREVEEHKAHAREYGWIDVGTKGKVVRFEVKRARKSKGAADVDEGEPW